jgi:hypothetical protein
MTALPTIHLNGTGADTLRKEYMRVSRAVAAAADTLAAATCNARDFYPQDAAAWQQAQAERTEMFNLLKRVEDYAAEWALHAWASGRGREVA